MDPLSQAALGAAWAQLAADRKRLLAATAVGAVSGMAPDADILIRSAQDPLLALEFHRHFTHSLSFVPVGALLCAVLLWPVFRRWLQFRQCFLFALLGLGSHGLLDAFTSFGTRLYWPFSSERVAWNMISVVDPLFTVPLIAAVAAAAWFRRSAFTLLGLLACAGYLSLGYVQNQRVTAVAQELAQSRAHTIERLEVRPSFGNILLWRTIYERRGQFYLDAIRIRRGPQLFLGEVLRKLDPARDFPWLTPGTQQWEDVERFRRFADDFLVVDPDNPNLIVDIRYSLLPNRGDGFWGIELDPAAGPETHAAYVTMPRPSTVDGWQLLDMIFR